MILLPLSSSPGWADAAIILPDSDEGHAGDNFVIEAFILPAEQYSGDDASIMRMARAADKRTKAMLGRSLAGVE